jgi:hypothetical protein
MQQAQSGWACQIKLRPVRNSGAAESTPSGAEHLPYQLTYSTDGPHEIGLLRGSKVTSPFANQLPSISCALHRQLAVSPRMADSAWVVNGFQPIIHGFHPTYASVGVVAGIGNPGPWEPVRLKSTVVPRSLLVAVSR